MGDRQRIIAPDDGAEIAAGRQLVMQPAVEDQEGLAAAVLAIDDARQIDPGLRDQPAAKLDGEAAVGQDRRARSERLFQRLPDRFDRQRLVPGEIGYAESATQIDQRRRVPRLVRQPGGQRDGGGLRIDDRLRIERLAARIDVKAAPVGTRRDQLAHQCGHPLGIDAEGRWPPAHLHARAAQLDIGVHPNRQARAHAQPIRDCQRAMGLALGLQVEGHACADRSRQLGIALAGPCEADRLAQRRNLGEFARRSDVEPVDHGHHRRQQGCERVGLDCVMQVDRREGGTKPRDAAGDDRGS